MKSFAPLLAAALLAALPAAGRADSVTDWNTRAAEAIAEAKMGTPPATRLMAILHTAVHEAIGATPRGPADAAAVAAASRTVLAKMLPQQANAIDATYAQALAAIADTPARTTAIETGEKAALAVIASRANDGATGGGEPYRPHAAAGAYVPTAGVAAPHWGARKGWTLSRPDQFRPAPPPALTSAAWARDYNEVRTLGGTTSTARTPEQTAAARFWEYSLPQIYFGLLRGVADQPGRTVADNARLYAATAQAMDDALIAVFDAKYHYNFWRPATAIRNGDKDGNDATERDAGWSQLVDAPMHPEYPSGHGILAGAVGAVLKAETSGKHPVLATSSPSAKGATRKWNRIDDFVQEVIDARVWSGIHYRFSTEAAARMGEKIGEGVVRKLGGQ